MALTWEIKVGITMCLWRFSKATGVVASAYSQRPAQQLWQTSQRFHQYKAQVIALVIAACLLLQNRVLHGLTLN